MLIHKEQLDDVMQLLSQLGVKWGQKSSLPDAPTYKGFFRGNLIGIYVDKSDVFELKCLDPAYAQEFDDFIMGFFQVDEESQ